MANRIQSAKAVFAILAAALVAAPALAHEFKAGSLEIEHPWTRVTPAGAKVAGGYVTIENKGGEADKLVGASIEIAGRTEIHEMKMDGGVMQMRPLPGGVEAPANGEAELKPGGIHLMFFDLKRPLKLGETIPGTLTFEKAGEVKVEFAVEPIGATAPDHGGHDEHKGH